jgi:hypothetical protein
VGASAWTYWVPYQGDVSVVLQELRDQVFRDGAYYRVRADMTPASIEELMEANDESGTHSILDVFTVAPAPQMGAVAPLGAAEQQALFGTARPSRADVEARPDAAMQLVTAAGPWAGVYVVAYEGDAPSEIGFFGHSGD